MLAYMYRAAVLGGVVYLAVTAGTELIALHLMIFSLLALGAL